jgi:hypothetical protein
MKGDCSSCQKRKGRVSGACDELPAVEKKVDALFALISADQIICGQAGHRIGGRAHDEFVRDCLREEPPKAMGIFDLWPRRQCKAVRKARRYR